MTRTLGEALPREMARVRDEVLPEYERIPEGRFAAAMMRASLDNAAAALAEGDVIRILAAYQDLKEYQL